MSLSQQLIVFMFSVINKVKSLFPQTSGSTDDGCAGSVCNRHLPLNRSRFHIKRHLYRLSGRQKASYSVEAAVALPVFMSFAVCIMFFIRLVMIGWAIDTSLSETVNTMAVCSKDPNVYAASAMFYTKLLTSDVKLDGAVLGGVAGVYLGESEVDKKDITLTAVYRVNLPIRMFSGQGLFIYQKKSARIWNGYDPHEEGADGEYVYVTPYGSAYHRSMDCPYINPSIKGVRASALTALKNCSGHRYGCCPLCGRKAGEGVYVTSWGECYHSSVSCSGLKRTLSMMKLSEAESRYHACPKCGGS